MSRVVIANFNIFIPYQAVQIKASMLTIMHYEILKIVKQHHFIEQRLKAFEDLSCQLYYYTPYCWKTDFWMARKCKFTPNWVIGDMSLSRSTSDNAMEKHSELSYYIQVSSYRVNLPTRFDELCTVFGEIPENKVKTLLRKLKLRNLERVCRTRAE